jgi:hypothetical protein
MNYSSTASSSFIVRAAGLRRDQLEQFEQIDRGRRRGGLPYPRRVGAKELK